MYSVSPVLNDNGGNAGAKEFQGEARLKPFKEELVGATG